MQAEALPQARGERGFSLMEVATAIGVISFALVALVGMFPVGLDNSRRAVSETRATQLLKMVVATLESEPFNAAPCFSPPTGDDRPSPLDLTKLPLSAASAPTNQIAFPENADALLYVSYDIRDVPRIVRLGTNSAPPSEALYRIELRFAQQAAPTAASSTTATPRVAGSFVDARLCNLIGKEACVAETQAYVPNFSRSGYPPTP